MSDDDRPTLDDFLHHVEDAKAIVVVIADELECAGSCETFTDFDVAIENALDEVERLTICLRKIKTERKP